MAKPPIPPPMIAPDLGALGPWTDITNWQRGTRAKTLRDYYGTQGGLQARQYQNQSDREYQSALGNVAPNINAYLASRGLDTGNFSPMSDPAYSEQWLLNKANILAKANQIKSDSLGSLMGEYSVAPQLAAGYWQSKQGATDAMNEMAMQRFQREFEIWKAEEEERQRKKAAKGGLFGTLGGLAGGVLGGIYGGPWGAAAGYSAGSLLGGAAGGAYDF